MVERFEEYDEQLEADQQQPPTAIISVVEGWDSPAFNGGTAAEGGASAAGLGTTATHHGAPQNPTTTVADRFTHTLIYGNYPGAALFQTAAGDELLAAAQYYYTGVAVIAGTFVVAEVLAAIELSSVLSAAATRFPGTTTFIRGVVGALGENPTLAGPVVGAAGGGR